MPKPTKKFELSLSDMELIETALRKSQNASENDMDPRAIRDLLGRLHNQKTFYRPDGIYVSG